MKPIKQKYIGRRLRNQLQNHGISGRLYLLLTFEELEDRELDASWEDISEEVRRLSMTESLEVEAEESASSPQAVEHRIVRETRLSTASACEYWWGMMGEVDSVKDRLTERVVGVPQPTTTNLIHYAMSQ